MQIQPISNHYTAQRTQKQNNPSFGATIKPKPGVIANVRNGLTALADIVEIKNSITRAREVFTEILESLISHNTNPESHRVFDASCEIPIKRIQFTTNGVTWLDSFNPKATKNWHALANKPNSALIIMTVKRGGVQPCVDIRENGSEITKTVTKIQDEAIEHYKKFSPTSVLTKYDLALEQGTAVKDVEL